MCELLFLPQVLFKYQEEYDYYIVMTIFNPSHRQLTFSGYIYENIHIFFFIRIYKIYYIQYILILLYDNNNEQKYHL